MTRPSPIGPLELALTPAAAHAALDLVEGSMTRDGSRLWLYDGIDPELFALVSALAKLGALLAGALAETHTAAGRPLSGPDVIATMRAHQRPNDGRSWP